MLQKSFISDSERIELLNWVSSISNLTNEANGKFCTYEKIKDLNSIPTCVNSIRKKCMSITGLCYVEPIYEDFIVVVKPNGFVKKHTDPTVRGHKHIRFNILVKKPQQGGNLIVDDVKISFEEGDCYILDTSKVHGISVVYGDISYNSIVFGFLVPNKQVTFL
jgi:hypothetical protein